MFIACSLTEPEPGPSRSLSKDQNGEPTYPTVPAENPASGRSPLLRQRPVMCFQDDLSDDEKSYNTKLLSRTDPSTRTDLTSAPSGEDPGAVAGIHEDGDVQDLHTVTLTRSVEESFGLDLEILSLPLRVLVAGLKPGGAAEWDSTGGLCPGDQIIRIGEKLVSDSSYQEICELMDNLPMTLSLEVQRSRPAVDRASMLMTSSGSINGATSIQIPANQGPDDIISGNSSRKPTERLDFQNPVTHISDFLSELCCDRNTHEETSPDASSCLPHHLTDLSEEDGATCRDRACPPDHSYSGVMPEEDLENQDAGSEDVSVSNGGLAESLSRVEEVKFASSGPQNPAAAGPPGSSSRQLEGNHPDQNSSCADCLTMSVLPSTVWRAVDRTGTGPSCHQSLSIYRDRSQPDPNGMATGLTVDLVTDASQNSDLSQQTPSADSGIRPEPDFSLTHNGPVQLHRTSALKLPSDPDRPAGTRRSKPPIESSPPKLKALSVKTELDQNFPGQNQLYTHTKIPKKQMTKFLPVATVTSFLNSGKQTSDGLLGGSVEPDRNVPKSLENFQPQPPVTQKTYMELRLSASPGLLSPVMRHNGMASLEDGRTVARLASRFSLSDSEKANGKTTNHPATDKPGLSTESSPILKSSQVLTKPSRLYIQMTGRRSLSSDITFSADYRPFSVQHKIKSFESLANFDRPASRSCEIQSFALTYTASLNQRIAGYMGLVNAAECRGHQRNPVSNEDCVMTTSPPSLPLLRRKHGRLPPCRMRKLRALSMPELENLCSQDFTRGHETPGNEKQPDMNPTIPNKTRGCDAAATKAEVTRVTGRDAGDAEKTPESTQPGWSIRLDELSSSAGSHHQLQTLISSQTTKSYIYRLLDEAKTSSEVNRNIRLVVLNKEEGSGLGFSVAGGLDLEQKDITVHRVFTKGAARLEGSIQQGDCVLSINGTSLKGKTHGEAVSCLHHARLDKRAVIVIWRNEDVNRSDRRSNTKDVCSGTAAGDAL